MVRLDLLHPVGSDARYYEFTYQFPAPGCCATLTNDLLPVQMTAAEVKITFKVVADNKDNYIITLPNEHTVTLSPGHSLQNMEFMVSTSPVLQLILRSAPLP